MNGVRLGAFCTVSLHGASAGRLVAGRLWISPMFGFGFRLYGMEMVSVQTRGNPMPVIRAGDLRSSLSIGSLWSAVAEDSRHSVQ